MTPCDDCGKHFCICTCPQCGLDAQQCECQRCVECDCLIEAEGPYEICAKCAIALGEAFCVYCHGTENVELRGLYNICDDCYY